MQSQDLNSGSGLSPCPAHCLLEEVASRTPCCVLLCSWVGVQRRVLVAGGCPHISARKVVGMSVGAPGLEPQLCHLLPVQSPQSPYCLGPSLKQVEPPPSAPPLVC